MSSQLFRALRWQPPVVTLLLLASVLITTVPQFFLSGLYDRLTGTLLSLRVPHYLFLPIFSHSPSILVPHVIGNVCVLLLFGGVSELLLGRRRFALLSLLTLSVTLVITYWRAVDTIHGVSGVIWGYHVPVLLLLIVYGEKLGRGRRFRRDPFVLLSALFFLFDFIGLHLLEVWILSLQPFENFGQVIHLVSVVVALPCTLIWRKAIERDGTLLAQGTFAGVTQAESPPPSPALSTGMLGRSPAVWLLGTILVINLFGTIDAVVVIRQASVEAEELLSSFDPPAGVPIEDVGRTVTVRFAQEMLLQKPQLRLRSISYEQPPVPELRFEWQNSKTLQLHFSRAFRKDEAVRLVFDVYRQGPHRVPIPAEVELRYGEIEQKK